MLPAGGYERLIQNLYSNKFLRACAIALGPLQSSTDVRGTFKTAPRVWRLLLE